MSPTNKPAPEAELALPDGSVVPLVIRRNPRARRILLHVGAYDGSVRLVLPRGVGLRQGLAFAQSMAGWVVQRRQQVPQEIAFHDGLELPVLGRTLRICHSPRLFAETWREKNALHVSCAADELPQRVHHWLRETARTEIRSRVASAAERIERPYRRIIITDPRTRWGSCSPSGNLSFSWRLVLAPEAVLDYVVAHEVAHLAQMNHSGRFWRVVDELCETPGVARDWLRRNGAQLHRYVARS